MYETFLYLLVEYVKINVFLKYVCPAQHLFPAFHTLAHDKCEYKCDYQVSQIRSSVTLLNTGGLILSEIFTFIIIKRLGKSPVPIIWHQKACKDIET